MNRFSRNDHSKEAALNRHIVVAAQERYQNVKQKRLAIKHRNGLHMGDWQVTCNLCNPKVAGFKPLTKPDDS